MSFYWGMLRVFRVTLTILGNTFTNITFSVILGIFIALANIGTSLFSKEEISQSSPVFQNSSGITGVIVGGIFWGIVVAVGFQLFGAFFDWLSQQVPSSISIMPMHEHDLEDIHNNDSQIRIRHHYAVLKVANLEYEELTDCYAVLKAIYVYDSNFGFVDVTNFYLQYVSSRNLGWKGSDSSYINIGPRIGEQFLRVYRLGIDSTDTSCVLSDFNICDKNYKGKINGGTKFFVTIEIYGKLKDKDINPRKFYGTVDIELPTKNDNGSFSYGLDIWKAKKVKKTITSARL